MSESDDLQELDGVGPAREEDLEEAGYESFQDLAEADHEELGEEIKNLYEDTALEIIVQAQNLTEMDAASVEEDPDVEEDDEPDDSDMPDPEPIEEGEPQPRSTEEDAEPDSESEEPEPDAESEEPPYDVIIEFDSVEEYDTLYHTLLEHRSQLLRENRAGADEVDAIIDQLREEDGEGSVTAEMTESDLNDLHNAIVQQRISYQGDNLIREMEAANSVEESVNESRQQHLF